MIPYIIGGIVVYLGAMYVGRKLISKGSVPAQGGTLASSLQANTGGLASKAKSSFTEPTKPSKQMPDINLTSEEEWAIIVLNGVTYKVHPRAIGPFTIGDAFWVARNRGWEVPTPELADAIWAAAPIKVLPNPMPTDGTFKAMMSPDTIAKNRALVEEQIAGRVGLVAGDHKDIVQSSSGKHGIYGWHVADELAADFTKRTGIPLHAPVTANLGAKIIQQFPSPHGDDWGDYSQYLYPIKRVDNNS